MKRFGVSSFRAGKYSRVLACAVVAALSFAFLPLYSGNTSTANAAPYSDSYNPVTDTYELDTSAPYHSLVPSVDKTGTSLNTLKVPTLPVDTNLDIGDPPLLNDTQKKIGGNVMYQRWGRSEDGKVDWLLNDEGTAYTDGYIKDSTPMPMEGVRVYAKWMETCGKFEGHVSKVYTAVTDYRGHFLIQMGDEITPRGVVAFDADPTSSAGCEKWKIWAVNPDDNRFTELYTPNFGNFFPLGRTNDTTWATNEVAKDHLYNVKIAYGDRIDNQAMHITDLEGNIVDTSYEQNQKYDTQKGGYINGRVGWNMHKATATSTWGGLTPLGNAGDIPAPGTKVYGSYLSDYAISQIFDGSAAEDIGWVNERTGKPYTIRGNTVGWNNDWEAKLQNWIKLQIHKEVQKYLAEVNDGNNAEACQAYQKPGEETLSAYECKNRAYIAAQKVWIAETVSAYVKQPGDIPQGSVDSATPGSWYRLQFAGTYGDFWYACGGAAELQAACKKENGDYKYFHRVAGTREGDPEGTWLNSNLRYESKHVNGDWLFVSPEEIPGASSASAFHANWYGALDHLSRGSKGLDKDGAQYNARYGNGGGDTVTYGAGWEGIEFLNTTDSSKRVDFALFPGKLNFEVVPWDNNENLAVAGDVAHTKTWGAPTQSFTHGRFEIEWKDSDGNVVATCKDILALSDGTLPSCDYTVPVDLAKETTYTAYLYTVTVNGHRSDMPVGSDSFTAEPVYIPMLTLHDVYPSAPADDIAGNYPSGQYPDGTASMGIVPRRMGQKGCIAREDTEIYDLVHTGMLPKGLSVDKCGLISGAPTETGVFVQHVSFKRSVKDGSKVYEVSTAYQVDIVVTDSSLPVISTVKQTEYHAEVGTKTNITFGVAGASGDVTPHGFVSPVISNNADDKPKVEWKLKEIVNVKLSDELGRAGLYFDKDTNSIVGTPTAEVEAHQKAPVAADDPATEIDETKGPNVWVTYLLERNNVPKYKTVCVDKPNDAKDCHLEPELDDAGNPVYTSETKEWTDAVPLAIMPRQSVTVGTGEFTKELRDGSETGDLLDPKSLDGTDISFKFQLAIDKDATGCTGTADGFDAANYFNKTPAVDSKYAQIADDTLSAVAPAPAGAGTQAVEGAWIKTLQYGGEVSKKGTFSFPELKFTKAGVYCFAITELPGDLSMIAHDKAVRHIQITVKETESGSLDPVPNVSITKGEGEGAIVGTLDNELGKKAATFVNVWNGVPVPAIPLTGGVGEYIFWLIGGSILLIALLASTNNLRWLRVRASRTSGNEASIGKGVVEL